MKEAKKISMLFLMLLYLLLLAKIMVIRHYPLYEAWLHILDFRFSNLQEGWTNANFIPFRSVIDYVFFTNIPLSFKTEQIFANVIAFAPLGAIGPLLWKRFVSMRYILGFVCFLSLGFELVQWIFQFGVFDIDQIMLNVLGCMVGFFSIKTLLIHGEKQTIAQKAKI